MDQSTIAKAWDRAGPGPAYRRLARAVGGAIARGELLPGAPLPTERSLAQDLGLSRVTVRAAYRALAEEGLLVARAGSGNYVRSAGPVFEQPLWRLSSFSDDMARRGRHGASRLLELVRDEPSTEEAAALALTPADRVVRLTRLRTVDGRPLGLEVACLPEKLAGAVPLGEGSLYAALAAQGLAPVRATQRLRAVTLDRPTAALLGVAEHCAAMVIERVACLGDGTPIEFTRCHYRGDAYEFVARMDAGGPT